MHRVDLKQIANLGNRMIQYAFAVHLSRLVGPCELVNVELPEWGIACEPVSERDFDADFLVTDFDERSMATLISRIRSVKAAYIRLEGFFQDINKLPESAYASRTLFPKSGKYDRRFGADQLVINVRAEEILDGIEWYPVVPPAFYRDLVEKTRLAPVFVGQVGPSAYVDELRSLFPEAEFISTGVPMDDFELVRSAKNICIAVSTFSWLAAWLSDAQQIFYPLLGFLHPRLTACYSQDVAPANLAPYRDHRYQFFLFPLIYGVNYHRVREIHRRAAQHWRQIPAEQVQFIRERAPILAPEISDVKLDSIWYAHNYPDAAMEIAEGWYSSPLHHYVRAGHARGYLPRPPLAITTAPLISGGKRATQSSLSQWSTGRTAEEDAAGALDGNIEKDCAFHTDYEPEPWWKCDLGAIFSLQLINIYNRRSISNIRDRALPLLVELSDEDVTYKMLHLCKMTDDFGETGVALRPFQIIVPQGTTARYVKLTVTGRTSFLHLAQVQIFGQESS